MTDTDLKDKIRKKKQRNMLAKELKDNKGPFALRVVSPKKQEYKRKKMRVEDAYEQNEGD